MATRVKKVDGAGAIADLRLLAKKSKPGIERALYKFGQTEMKESKRRVPVKYGTLRDSGTVDEPRWEGDNCVVELAYGGAASEYAIPVHEDLEAFHPVGEAKYLEGPLSESAPHMADRVAADFKKFTGIE